MRGCALLSAMKTSPDAGLNNLRQLIELRWIAVMGQVITIEAAHYSFHLPLPLREMLLTVGCLAVFNAVSFIRWKIGQRHAHSVQHVELFLALLVDVLVLTTQLYFSGGTSNPFIFLYLLQITLAAALLPGPLVWAMALMATLCFVLLTHNALPLPLNTEFARGLASPYVLGLLVCFILNAALVVIFMQRIAHNLRQHDTQLAAIRQRAAEEEHIVRMGLLASGAAHELGTPLSTLAVILGDWQRDSTFLQDSALQEDICEMRNQVQRCKTIVSSILLSAGEARGEASRQTTVCQFLDTLARKWQASRTVDCFVYDNHFGADCAMVADTTLEQMVFNVLDNAREASPAWVGLQAERDTGLDELLLTVRDRGPGFTPSMLEQLGRPYQSGKADAGHGLGLFLALNVARTLGGSVQACNRSSGGAAVRIRLPLAAITLRET